ncbi:hypothetical protein Syun_028804 [Stephania yunnanensis]|uniref:GDT1 family protein n=1 Tax=Stephania yunnanensis TaxID=152371 RepID=A0AAP0E484_9MAGN
MISTPLPILSRYNNNNATITTTRDLLQISDSPLIRSTTTLRSSLRSNPAHIEVSAPTSPFQIYRFARFAMVMDWIRLRRGIFLVILVAVAFSASVSAQVLERESERKSEALKRVTKDLVSEHGKWGDKNDQKLVIRDAAGGEIPASSGLGIFDAFFASLSMILVSEIGDETFIIAALMAMRHPKSIVLSGALGALIVMTISSSRLNSSYWFELFIFETAFCCVGFHFDVKLPFNCDIWFHHAHEDYEFTS